MGVLDVVPVHYVIFFLLLQRVSCITLLGWRLDRRPNKAAF